MLAFDPHPLLDAAAFTTTFPKAMELMPPMPKVEHAPLATDDEVRGAVRDLLRHGGYKPTGRGKPASEYLLRAVAEGALASINPAVDCCNAVSLHTGLPISVVDLELAVPLFRIALAAKDTQYVFNASGQTIDVEGLLCLFDAQGACANAVKDSQRTKTRPQTTKTLTVVWGTTALAGRTAKTLAWYRELLAGMGATTALV